ncbi:integrase family protein [Methylobacterium sp. 4-46]|uniref:tyrosine-type recombinase/integrase n=1 Tax=unclassified Methylobacterium TaxID=2615210 RepID=UPI000165C558|nr:MULTISPECIES: site-specific integrase [Methylobacterium]ACA18251.1 integrase family protein [Methylobacterium sp. 4-46]WFT77546.1 site-specific integrase [Methylobacterium nodulans]
MATIRKRELPSGKIAWLASYTDGGGKRRFRQFATRKEADAFLTRARSEVAHGVHIPDSQSMTVGQAADAWLKHAEEGGLEWSTVLHYQQHVNEHIRPLIGSLRLTQVTTPRVYSFAEELRAKGRSPEMVRRAVQSLGRIFRFAKGRGLAGQNPVADVKLKRSKRDQARVEIPTREELRAILGAAQGRWRPLIVTAMFTALRASELRGLRWSDVDLKRRVLTVRQRADAWKRIGPPKSEAGTRDVPLAPMVVNTLREWRLACPKGELDLVFPSGAGQVEHHPNIIARGWEPTQIAAGVVEMVDGKDKAGNPAKAAKGRYNFHALRHAAASMFIESGMTPKRVQAIMGHSSIIVTYDTYGHLFSDDEADQNAMRTIEERLLG